jgi:hypothetical protein
VDTWKVTSGLICPLVIVYLRCFGNGYEWVHIIIYLILYNNSIHDDSSTQVSRLLTRFCFVHVSSAAHLWLRFHLFLVDFYRGKTVFKHWLPGLCYSPTCPDCFYSMSRHERHRTSGYSLPYVWHPSPVYTSPFHSSEFDLNTTIVFPFCCQMVKNSVISLTFSSIFIHALTSRSFRAFS